MFYYVLYYLNRPIESHNGARETIIMGPYRNLILYAPRSREETWVGEGVLHHHLTRGLREHHKLPQRGLGQSPGQKWILC